MLGLQELILPITIIIIIVAIIGWKGRDWFKGFLRTLFAAKNDYEEVKKEFKDTKVN